MSVPKDKRTEGQLSVNVSARNACTYILCITENQKNFPETQVWFANQLRQTALDIDLWCWEANNIYVGDSIEKYEKRMRLQDESVSKCTAMLELTNISKSLYHMPNKRYRYMTRLYSELRAQIRKWHKSDMERLSP